MAKWPWRSGSMPPIFNLSWENPKMHIWCKFGDSILTVIYLACDTSCCKRIVGRVWQNLFASYPPRIFISSLHRKNSDLLIARVPIIYCIIRVHTSRRSVHLNKFSSNQNVQICKVSLYRWNCGTDYDDSVRQQLQHHSACILANIRTPIFSALTLDKLLHQRHIVFAVLWSISWTEYVLTHCRGKVISWLKSNITNVTLPVTW